jgi:hypothetical protein
VSDHLKDLFSIGLNPIIEFDGRQESELCKGLLSLEVEGVVTLELCFVDELVEELVEVLVKVLVEVLVKVSVELSLVLAKVVNLWIISFP